MSIWGVCACVQRRKKIQICLKCRTKTQYTFKKAVCHSHFLGMMQFILIFIPFLMLENCVTSISACSCTGFIGELFHIYKDSENFFFRDAVVVESTNFIFFLVVLLNF